MHHIYKTIICSCKVIAISERQNSRGEDGVGEKIECGEKMSREVWLFRNKSAMSN